MSEGGAIALGASSWGCASRGTGAQGGCGESHRGGRVLTRQEVEGNGKEGQMVGGQEEG